MRVCDDAEITETRSYPSATKSSIDTSVARHSSTLVDAVGTVCDQPALETGNTAPAPRMNMAPQRIDRAEII